MLAQIKIARGRVAAVRAALENPTPEDVAGCLPLLEDAIGCLGAMPVAPGEFHAAREPGLAGELDALRFDLGVMQRLVEGGAEFYRNWARALATVAGGYTPSGEPAALTAPGSVSVEG